MKNETTSAPAPVQRPRYESPKIQVMSERDILNTFQITQSMGGWWITPSC